MSAPLSTETTPPRVTLFTPEIPLGPRDKAGRPTEVGDGGPQTAVYLPPGVDTKSDKVNAVFWLHGHKDATTSDIKAYLADARFAFREILLRRASRTVSDGGGAPGVVLVAPTLGPLDESGTLASNATGYLDQVRRAMVNHLSFPPSLSWSEMVLACHSGGGKPARLIATEVAAMMEAGGGKLAEIWHFDSIYENEAQTRESPEPTAAWWASFAAAHPGTKLKVFYLTTTAHALYLQEASAARGLTNVTVTPSADPVHATVARTHFPACYDAWLSDLAAAAPQP